MGIFVHRECLALQRAGLDVRVLSPLPYSPGVFWYKRRWKELALIPRSDTWDGIRVRYPRYVRPPGAFYRKCEPFAMFPGLYSSLRTWSRVKPFDLIHAHGLLPGGMAAVLLSRAFHVPCVCHARGSDVNVYPWESKANFLLTRHVIENCDAPVATSRDLAEKMSSMSRIARKITVLYKSVDTALFVPQTDRRRLRNDFGIDKKPFVALYVGTVSHEKGLDDLAKAWNYVEEKIPGSLLIVVGIGPLIRKFVPMGSKVLLCGARPSNEVARWMQASDVLVLPSHSEGMPNVILEAMACELPIVATPVGGIPEAVVHNETGLLVPVGDWQGLASAILALAENRDLRLSMGKAGRRRIETLFRWENYASEAQRLYRSLL